MIKCTFLNKEKKIRTYGRCTICTLKGHIDISHIPYKIDSWIFSHPCIEAEYDYGGITFTVSAKAVQSLSDDYSALIGARLAESRAKKKAYNFCQSLCKMYAEYHNAQLASFAESMQQFEIYKNKEIEHQNEILDLNEPH